MTAQVTLDAKSLMKSQFGEDAVLWEVFKHRQTGYFVEVGAYNGVDLSNTYFLEQVGWCGMLVEPIYPLCEMAAKARPRSHVVHAACSKPEDTGTATFTVAQNVPVLSFLKTDDDHVERCKREGARLVEIEVPVATLDQILLYERRNPPRQSNPWVPKKGWNVDLVSIDTEGCELDVLEGFDLERIKPRVLVIENDRPSGDEIEPYLNKRGYRKFHRQVINDFYVRKDDPAEDLKLEGLA